MRERPRHSPENGNPECATARTPDDDAPQETTYVVAGQRMSLSGEYISVIGRVSRGITGRTGGHLGLNNPYPTGPNCSARTRSTGSRRGTALSGWRGCPTPAVSHPLNWFLAEAQPCQAGEVAQLRRYLSAQLVIAEDSHSRLARLPNSGGISPAQLVPAEGQPCQVGEVAQLQRYLSAQLVLAEEQHFQVGEVAQLRRYLTPQLVTSRGTDLSGWRGCQLRRYLSAQPVAREEVQIRQVGEVAQLRRYLTAQLVVAEDERCNIFRLARLPNSSGISPLNWFGRQRIEVQH